jgi:uncharacterized protein (DUF1330 family)
LATALDPVHYLQVIDMNMAPSRDDEKSEAIAPTALPWRSIGAEVLYVGDCSTVLVAPSGRDWDAVLIVRYPSRQAFSAMVRDPAYQAVTHLRTEALTEAVLQATVPWQTAP